MVTYAIPIRGPGSPPPSDGEQTGPVELSSVEMSNRWTFHAYRQSYDGKTQIIHQTQGVEILRNGERVAFPWDLTAHNPREFIFHPDNQHVAFWAPTVDDQPVKRIAVQDLNRLDPERAPPVVYTPPAQHIPFGFEWSPAGDALFVIERTREEETSYTEIQRVEYPGGRVSRLIRFAGTIDFFMPPVSRFENGSGVSTEPFRIIFGAEDGLYVCDPKERDQQDDGPDGSLKRISDLPAMGLHNIEWHPDPNREMVVLFFRRPVPNAEGLMMRGLFLVDIDALNDGDPDFMEQLYELTDVHTLWFSPKGTFVTWASLRGLWWRAPDEPASAEMEIVEFDDEGQPLPIRGVSWNDEETKICYTAGNRVFIYDLELAAEIEEQRANGEFDEVAEEDIPSPKYEVARVPTGFVAEPSWIDEDTVMVSSFEDTRAEMRDRRNTPNLDFDDVTRAMENPSEFEEEDENGNRPGER